MAAAEPAPSPVQGQVEQPVVVEPADLQQQPEAEPGQVGAEVDPPAVDEPPVRRSVAQQLDRWRLHLLALEAGELDPAIDADALLSLELSTDALLGAADLQALRDALGAEDPSGLPEDAAPDQPSTDPEQARARLVAVLARWLSKDPAQREAVLVAHRQASRAASEQRAQLEARLERARRGKAQLDALVEGTLDPAVDPRPLLRIPLAAGLIPDPPTPADTLRQRVRVAELELLQAQHALLERSADERRALLAAHQARAEAATAQVEVESVPEVEPPEVAVNEAEEAAVAVAREKERALAQARAAQTEARRLLAQELARLLGVKEEQARFEVELAERRLVASEHRQRVEQWQQRVVDMVQAIEAFSPPAEDPDVLYPKLRQELAEARDRLDAMLAGVVSRQSDVPRPGALVEQSETVDSTELRALHRELVANADQLDAQEATLRWELADGYRADIIDLNATRLRLLGITSSSLQDRVTGFGPAGARQVSDEVTQIGLELHYRGLSLPRHLLKLWSDLRTSPVLLLVGLLKLVAMVLVFRWWRRRAPELLAALQKPPAEERRRARRARRGGMATAAWYLARIRKPLEWLALAAAVVHGTSAVEVFPELALVWLVVLWLLLGSIGILLVDAIAARENRRQGGPSPTASVRIRSLRLIGLSVAYTGLVLSLADALVGKGAIYAWVLGTCWLLAIPIALLLTRWWRTHVLAAYEREPAGRLADWVRARQRGWASYPAAMIGGAVLVGRGSWRWLVRRAARFETTRHLLAYLFRREVARQAEASGRHDAVVPAEDELRARLVEPLPHRDALVEVGEASLRRLQEAVERPGSTFSVVVGERGMGKTTLLARLCDQHEGPTMRLSCPSSGMAGLLAMMARQLGLSADAGLDDVGAALCEGGACLVTLDDIQRLVQPTIGGMRGLDDLGHLARLAGQDVAWIATIGAAAWQYVSRARGDRLHFDDVLRLQPWDEAQICALMQRRCERLDARPSFEGLVIPRQYDDDELDEDRRAEIGYYRILWDYAGGNPHVASWFWAQSLFRDARGQLVVRLFREPPASELDALPLTLQFVLRSLVQLETATKPEVSAAIRMPLAEAEDALRFALGRGYVSQEEGVFSITWPWYRAITRMLQRQHLLAT
ncbi:MAG: AAA family ATPase [Myxococcota bacterium]